jgi:hypothetical protein
LRTNIGQYTIVPRSTRSYLGSCVNFCLPHVLSLSKHGRGHKLVSVLSTREFRRFQEDCRPVFPRERFPLVASSQGTPDRGIDFSRTGLVIGAKVVGVIVRHGLLGNAFRFNLERERKIPVTRQAVLKKYRFAINDAWNFKGQVFLHLGKSKRESSSF